MKKTFTIVFSVEHDGKRQGAVLYFDTLTPMALARVEEAAHELLAVVERLSRAVPQ